MRGERPKLGTEDGGNPLTVALVSWCPLTHPSRRPRFRTSYELHAVYCRILSPSLTFYPPPQFWQVLPWCATTLPKAPSPRSAVSTPISSVSICRYTGTLVAEHSWAEISRRRRDSASVILKLVQNTQMRKTALGQHSCVFITIISTVRVSSTATHLVR